MVKPLSGSDEDFFSCASAGEAQALKINATVAEKKLSNLKPKKRAELFGPAHE